jgi:hypothetical protein
METIRETQKKYCSRAMAISVVLAFLLILAGHKGLGKGLVLGTIFSVFNFILMGESLPSSIGTSRSRTYVRSFLSVSMRYAVLAIPLVLAVKIERIHLLTTVLGIFMVQLVIVVDHFYQFSSSTRKL